ncbi:efflux RND transporter periplasmic adaptor subunit [Novilysobacter spongiicola]|uniref:Membrane fusion protein, multidrug efflux system n=1 Tax=Lysobacter spongiicola DSM 21749 TaxID=1122188 RepID=A0A1T4QGX1_9GAMM|nr:efflux RND transporter periplasmic adaptor subunit [Lysobacter spongiicola]SKA02969.1 membrane fusion protein, multidrug efflux system [Lysobacter spongiicola DSM 21749]
MRITGSGRSYAPTIAIALLLAAALAGCSSEPQDAQAARPVLVTQPREAGEASRSFAGDIRAREESTLSFQVGGQLVQRHVDAGDHVQRGQVLATLDADDLDARARAARAELAAAQAELGRARADQVRYSALADQQLVSRSAMDAQDAAATAAQGRVDAARAQLEVAGNQASRSQLRAPVDGVVAARHAEAGQVVSAGQPVFTLAADGAREVVFAIPEGEVGGIQPGLAVEVEAWAEPGARWPAVVREVSPLADPASRTFQARAEVEAPADALELGQSARVFVDRDSAGGGMSVPLAALQEQGDGGFAVFVLDPEQSTLRLQPVEVGRFGSERVPVSAGLERGDWVVAAGGHLLREGQQVVGVDRQNRPVLD